VLDKRHTQVFLIKIKLINQIIGVL